MTVFECISWFPEKDEPNSKKMVVGMGNTPLYFAKPYIKYCTRSLYLAPVVKHSNMLYVLTNHFRGDQTDIYVAQKHKQKGTVCDAGSNSAHYFLWHRFCGSDITMFTNMLFVQLCLQQYPTYLFMGNLQKYSFTNHTITSIRFLCR